jgi:hypothetical protein
MEHLIGEHYRLAEGPAGHRGRQRDRVACRGGAGPGAGGQHRPDRRVVPAAGVRRLLVHDRGRVLADLACAIADGAEVISDFRVVGDREDVFGLVASVPTAWRVLDEIAGGGERALGRISVAVNAARRRAWAAAAARHGALPGIRVAGKMLEGVTCIRLDASVVTCHSDKEGAEPNFKGFGLLTELPELSSLFSGQVRLGTVTVPGHDRARRAWPGNGPAAHPAAGQPSGDR